MNPTRNNFAHQKSGYMLVEILVSLSIFALITVMVVGAVLAILDANAKSFSMKAATDNLNATIEHMARTIRMGEDYVQLNDSSIMFYPQGSNKRVYYGLSSNGTIIRTSEVGGNSQWGPFELMTDPTITIDSLTFKILGTTRKRVFINIMGTASSTGGTSKQTSTFIIETTVSQRRIVN